RAQPVERRARGAGRLVHDRAGGGDPPVPAAGREAVAANVVLLRRLRERAQLQQPEDVPVVGEELRVGGDALLRPGAHQVRVQACQGVEGRVEEARPRLRAVDRKSTRLNSSHVAISYAVFCLKKKKKNRRITDT